MKDRCILISAHKKNPLIPDLTLKKLAGRSLLERSLDLALACAAPEDIFILTSSEEAALVCERAGARHVLPADPEAAAAPREVLDNLARNYRRCVVIDPACPLLSWADVESAWKKSLKEGCESLVSVKELRGKIWDPSGGPPAILSPLSGGESALLAESPALSILKLPPPAGGSKSLPFLLNERALEIRAYNDLWICERALERRHVVFVVAGYPAIGMGHVYRALMLAHEINNHKITFVCARESELAAEHVARRDYHVVRQGPESLEETVIAQNPDLVVNDFLDSSAAYVKALKDFGAACVNFEDEGPGALLADLVINALYEAPESHPNWRCGPDYFCLRDEFVNASRNPFRPDAKTLLISFGGTDQRNATMRVLNIVEPLCRARGMAIRIVAGPGYAHKEALEKKLKELDNPLISFTWATNVMSRMMEGADLAICSAGRTVYELAHMRVPGIVLAAHEREARHRFARPANGFAFAGVMDKIGGTRIRNLFLAMLKGERRARFWRRQNALSFMGNKARVTTLIQELLEPAKEAL